MTTMRSSTTPTRLSTLTWQRALIIVAMLGFSAFVLWLTASRFDGSEVKSLLLLSSGFVTREFLPIVKALLTPTVEAYTRGGQVE